MQNKKSEIYKEWLQKAGEDERATSIILKEGGIFGIVCFHAHQMAEKSLKGLLVFHNIRFHKTHDLFELERLLLRVEAHITEYENDFKLLNPYYFETRYPGDYPEFTVEEAKAAFEAAARIKNFVLKRLNKR